MIMEKIWCCLRTLLGFGILLEMIVSAVLFQREILDWAATLPLLGNVIIFVSIVGGVFLSLALILGCDMCCDTGEGCQYTYKGGIFIPRVKTKEHNK